MGRLISDKFAAWQEECEQRFQQLKANEEELNRIFIDIYGLQDELTPEVEDKDVTVRRADLTREIKSLLSYAVGCLFGRYSLDAEGLVYAGGEWDASKYVTLQPVKDNVLPLCDEEYFGVSWSLSGWCTVPTRWKKTLRSLQRHWAARATPAARSSATTF